MSKGAASQEKIREAAFTLFVSQGYHGTSMRQIAESAGMTPASIYNHFESKEGIFRQVLERHHPYHELLPIMESAQGKDTEEMLREVTTRAFQSIRTRKELLHLLFIEIVEFDGRHLGEIFSVVSPKVFSFLQVLDTSKGELRPISKPNLLLSLVGMVMSQWILEAVFLKNIRLPGVEDHFDAALDIYLHGILASRGEK
ncbi:MAG: TetR/AcrR family transcriptional regulator [Anaerolineales bacterium]